VLLYFYQCVCVLPNTRFTASSDMLSPSRKLGCVGKGLLFDTGGYNIKRGMMELMKYDCGGAAAIFGAAKAIACLEPEQVEVHFVVAACEVRGVSHF
jgi:leucyl aminopeptidase